jgi:hypothetical protein
MTKLTTSSFKNTLILIFLGIIILMTTFSSKLPDGLEWTAEKLGFMVKKESSFNSPFRDYSISETLSPETNQIFSALLGAFLLIGLIILLMTWSKRKTVKK